MSLSPALPDPGPVHAENPVHGFDQQDCQRLVTVLWGSALSHLQPQCEGGLSLRNSSYDEFALAQCAGCQCCPAHGPTPATRSTEMWVMYPGGGLSIGGKRTSGPR